MYKIYFNDKLAGETDNEEKIKKEINKYTKKVLQEINPIISKIKDIEELIKDISEKESTETTEEYMASLRNTNPEFIEKLENLAKEISGDNYIKLNILSPSVGTIGWTYKINDTTKIQTLNNLRMSLRDKIPNEYNTVIIEE